MSKNKMGKVSRLQASLSYGPVDITRKPLPILHSLSYCPYLRRTKRDVKRTGTLDYRKNGGGGMRIASRHTSSPRAKNAAHLAVCLRVGVFIEFLPFNSNVIVPLSLG